MDLGALLDIRILIPVGFSALYSLLWGTAAWRSIRRGHFFLKALDDSTSSLAEMEHSPTVDGFVAALEPAPAPFRTFVVTYQPASSFNPLLLLPPLRKQHEYMYIRGQLSQPPTSELVWTRGRTPGVAAVARRQPRLWQMRYLDVWDIRYAVRGENTGAIENEFRALHARFGPLLTFVHIHNPDATAAPLDEHPLSTEDEHFVIGLRVAELGLHEIPPLVAAVRATARAALLS